MVLVLAIVAPGQGAQTPGFLSPWLEDPVFAEELAELDQRIEDEARARLQALDDQRALRKSGVRSVDDIDEDDDFFDEEDDDGPEIIYVRD